MGFVSRCAIALGVVYPLAVWGVAQIIMPGKANGSLIVKEGKVHVVKVITGLVGTGTIEITDGVASGDIFVARAGSFVRDGDAVSPVILKASEQ